MVDVMVGEYESLHVKSSEYKVNEWVKKAKKWESTHPNNNKYHDLSGQLGNLKISMDDADLGRNGSSNFNDVSLFF